MRYNLLKGTQKLGSAQCIDTKKWKPICRVDGVSVDKALTGINDDTYRKISVELNGGNVDRSIQLCNALKSYQRVRYLATTQSEQEFEALRKEKATAASLFSTGDPSLMGLNDYEVEEVLREMNRLIREARKEKKRKRQ